MACLDENDAIALLLHSSGASTSARAHLHECEPCRELVATIAKVVVDDASEGSPGWGAPTLRPGTRIGALRVLEPIGRGAMGTVVLAHDERLRRRVALKILAADVSDAAALRRLRAEARSMARLRHPGVVEVLDVGMSEHGPYVAMEYVEGHDLRAWLASSPRPPHAILEVLRQAGHGLAAAHAAGLVHRDFKPANVLVGRDGRVRVADFGLAILRDDPEADTASRVDPPERARVDLSTRRGTIAGTPAYMAPEQLRAAAIGPAADQFAFCVTAYEALAGHRPFPEHTLAARLEAIESGRVQPPARAIPRRVLAALHRGLHPDPHRRHVDMRALLAALDPPRPRTGRAVVLALGVGSIALAIALGTGGRDSPCDDAPEPAWTPRQRDRLRAAWEAEGAPPFATARILRTLDAYAGALADARHEACRDATSTPESTAVDVVGCLHTRHRELHAFVTDATDARPDRADAWAGAAAKLRPPDDCFGSSTHTTHDPVAAAKASELKATYLHAEARGDRARMFALRPEILAAADAALAAGDARVQADLLHVVGVIDTGRGDYASAAGFFEQAYLVAQGAGLTKNAFDAALACSMISGSFRGDPHDAWRWARHARAVLAQREGDEERSVALLVFEGSLHLLEDDLPAAKAALTEAEARATPALPEHLRMSIHCELARVHAQQGADDACRDAYATALQIGETTLGPEHPDLLRPLVGISTCEITSKRYADAEAHLRRAIALAERIGDPLAEASAHGNLGLMFRNTYRPTAALRELLRADALLRDVYGEDHVEAGRSAGNVAEALLRVGRWDDAAASARESIRVLTASPIRIDSLVYSAELALASAELELAVPEMIPRFEALVGEAPTGNYRAEAIIGLLQALHAEGRTAEAIAVAAPLLDDPQADIPAISRHRFTEGLLSYALALRDAGRHEDSRAVLTRAAELADGLQADDPRGIVARITQAAAVRDR